jgi:hypothetical protein
VILIWMSSSVISGIDFERMFARYGWGVDLLDVVMLALQSASGAYYFVRESMDERWSEAEPIIARDAKFATYYAIHVVKGRWLEAEPVIAKSAGWASMYAKNVIKGRWLEAEP